MGGIKAQYECIKAFSETDFTEDLKAIDVPVLVMHGTDDQIVPYADSAPLSVALLKNGTLKSYDGFPHGMCHDPCGRDQRRSARLHRRAADDREAVHPGDSERGKAGARPRRHGGPEGPPFTASARLANRGTAARRPDGGDRRQDR